MYAGVANSPDTFLTAPLASGGAVIYVADSSVFGPLPTLAVLGSGANAETVLVSSKRSDGGLSVQREVEGQAKDWTKATIIARNFTNFDYKQIVENIGKLNQTKQENLTAGSNIQISSGRISATDTKYDDTQVKQDIQTLKNAQLSKATQSEAETGTNDSKYMTPQGTKQAIQKLAPKPDLSGYVQKDGTKVLSTNDYTNTDKKKLSGIETGAQKNAVTSVQGRTGAVSITKNDVKSMGFQEHVVLTEAEFNALSSTQQNAPDIFYYIKE